MILRLLLIAAALYVLYFAGLGNHPLADPNEPVYGQVAREMALGGDWLTPHLGGKIWFDKPPLFYWLTAASVFILGPTEFAVRLPSALLGAGLVLLVYALAIHDFGRSTALLAAAVIATSLQQVILARAAVTDMTLAVCLIGALYAYRRWLDSRWGLGWAILCGFMAGLSMLAKGPVGPVLLGAAFFIHLWRSGRLKRLGSTDTAAAAAAFLFSGLPWFVLMYLLHRDAFLQGFVVTHNIQRFLRPEHAGQTGSWNSYFRNFPVLAAFFFPWSVFLPQAVWRKGNANEGARLACIWMAVVFVFFSVSKTQLVTYIFPLYPAAALLVAALWREALDGDAAAARGLKISLAVALAIGTVGAAALISVARRKYPEAVPAAFWVGVILVGFLAVSLGWVLRMRNAQCAMRPEPCEVQGCPAPSVVQGGMGNETPPPLRNGGKGGFPAGVRKIAWWLQKSPRPPFTKGGKNLGTEGERAPKGKHFEYSNVSWAFFSLITGMAVLVSYLVFAVMPLASARISTRDLVADIPREPGARVATFRLSHPQYITDPQSLLFYLGGPPEILLDKNMVERLLCATSPAWVICRQSNAPQILPPGSELWKKSGKFVVLANKAAISRKGKTPP